MRKKKVEAGHNNTERWLLTYSDLITLLMIFFVVLYTLSKVDADKFKAVADSLNAAIGGGTPSKIELQTDGGPSVLPLEKAQEALKQPKSGSESGKEAEVKTIQDIKKQIDKFVASNGLQNRVETTIEERGLVVSIRDTLLFASGSSAVTDDAHQILNTLSSILAGLPNYLRIEGHTDNAPIHTTQFPSNWELSVARAVNVVNVLISQKVAPEKLSASGYGEYRPVAPNTSPANMDKNRRVDMVIVRSVYDVTEPKKPVIPGVLPLDAQDTTTGSGTK